MSDLSPSIGQPVRVDAARRGADNALLGVLLFIASEAMFFAGLFAAYFNARAGKSPWPPEGFELEPGLASVLTVVLIASSFTMQWALGRIKRGDRRGLRIGLVLSAVLGVVFLSGQAYDYSTLGFGPGSGTYGALFFTLTGFHGAHVFAGVIAIVVMLSRTVEGQFSAGHHTAIEAVGAYWHFVDVVWLCLFSMIYLVR